MTSKQTVFLTVLLFSGTMILSGCKKENPSERLKTVSETDKLSVLSSSPQEQIYINHINSIEFQNQIDEIGLSQIKNDGLTLEVIDFENVIQTTPTNFVDVGINPLDIGLDPIPTVIIKFIVTGSGPWGGLPDGVYFLDTDTGKIYNILGSCVNC